MEPWQYSALQSQFSSLIQLLSGNSKSKSTSDPPIKQEENMNIDSLADGDTIKIGVKRKMNDLDTDSIDPSKRSRNHQLSSFCSTLTLDMYTQTDMSFLSSNYTTLANIVEVVEENKKKLGCIEQVLSSLNDKINMFIYANAPDNNNEKGSLIKSLVTTPGSTDNTSDAIDDATQVSSLMEKTGMSSNDQSVSNTSWTFNQEHHTDVKPCRRDSRFDSSLSQSLDIGVPDVSTNVLVPVIFASDNKRKRTSTAEIPLQDLLNGNIVNPEDNISMFRGCWLGDRHVPDSRIWYFGDSKIIQRAEASGTNPAKLSLNLLEALFTREEMAASNVNGARGRDLLDPIKIKAIYAHINYKFPTDSDKQELRWHLLKPRIDSKCRAQRRIQRDYQVIGDNHSGIPNKEKPFRSKLTKPSLDPKIKDELLYGVAKPDSVRTPRQHALSYITMETKESDESSDYVEPAQHVDHSHSLTVVIPQ